MDDVLSSAVFNKHFTAVIYSFGHGKLVRFTLLNALA
jgi:hypothetical protein